MGEDHLQNSSFTLNLSTRTKSRKRVNCVDEGESEPRLTVPTRVHCTPSCSSQPPYFPLPRTLLHSSANWHVYNTLHDRLQSRRSSSHHASHLVRCQSYCSLHRSTSTHPRVLPRERLLASVIPLHSGTRVGNGSSVPDSFLAGKKKKVRSFHFRPFSTGTDFRKNSIAFPTSSSRPCMRNETLVVREAPRFWRRRWSDGPEAEWAGRRHVGSSSMRFNKNLVRPVWAQDVGEGEQE